MLGFNQTPGITTAIALALVALSTLVNLAGTKLLARVAMFGFICEIIGAIIVGTYLLVFERHQPFSVVFDTFGIVQNGAYWPAFLAAAVVGLFTCYGFEACGDVAEETPNPGIAIPRAMRMTIYVGMAAAAFVCLALHSGPAGHPVRHLRKECDAGRERAARRVRPHSARSLWWPW